MAADTSVPTAPATPMEVDVSCNVGGYWMHLQLLCIRSIKSLLLVVGALTTAAHMRVATATTEAGSPNPRHLRLRARAIPPSKRLSLGALIKFPIRRRTTAADISVTTVLITKFTPNDW